MGLLRPYLKDVLSHTHEPIPLTHVAVIMDGNRRWANKRHLPHLVGHREGVKSLKRLVKHAGQRQLKYLTVYAFSSENWNRCPEEVNYLLALLAKVIDEELDELNQSAVCLKFIGQLSKMSRSLYQSFQRAMDVTINNQGLHLQVAVNYGSRLEITEAIVRMVEDVKNGRLSMSSIDEELVSSYLYTANIPDPDLMIRTGGEMRLSNYLLWQSAYTELYVTPVLWPDFKPEHFDQALKEFAARNRRFGGD